MRFLLCLVMVSASLLLCNRSIPLSDTTGGGGSEVEVRGMIYDNADKPAASVAVRLIAQIYNPVADGLLDKNFVDTTDQTGRYSFHGVKLDTYNIVAVQLSTGMRAMVSRFGVTETDTVAAPRATVNKPGSIRLAITDSVDTANGYFYVPGTTLVGYPRGSKGFVQIDSVPAGTIPAVAYCSKTRSATVVRYGISVSPGETTILALPAWKFSRRLYLNTTESGAGVNVTIRDYPVLVRLSGQNFDFSQARWDGADIRFCKSDNSAMNFEIDRWDSAAGRAEIWVKVDTVFGNDSSHYLNMLWGNSAAAPASNTEEVYDTSGGILADMHCGPEAVDVTDYHHSVSYFGVKSVEGLIGAALQFDGNDSIRISGLLGKPSNLTIGAWVQSSTKPAAGYSIVSIGDAVYTGLDFAANSAGTLGCFRVADGSHVILGSGQGLCDGQWHYVAFTFDAINKIQTLYIDGAVAGVQNNASSINYSGAGINTLIGKHGNGGNAFNFIGKIDEIRISKECRSAVLFKMNYMSQKPDAALVVFK